MAELCESLRAKAAGGVPPVIPNSPWLPSLALQFCPLSFSLVAQPNSCLRPVSSGCCISQEVFAVPEPHFLQGLQNKQGKTGAWGCLRVLYSQTPCDGCWADLLLFMVLL